MRLKEAVGCEGGVGERNCRQTDKTVPLLSPSRYEQTSRDMEHGTNGAAAATSKGELAKSVTIEQDKKANNNIAKYFELVSKMNLKNH